MGVAWARGRGCAKGSVSWYWIRRKPYNPRRQTRVFPGKLLSQTWVKSRTECATVAPPTPKSPRIAVSTRGASLSSQSGALADRSLDASLRCGQS